MNGEEEIGRIPTEEELEEFIANARYCGFYLAMQREKKKGRSGGSLLDPSEEPASPQGEDPKQASPAASDSPASH